MRAPQGHGAEFREHPPMRSLNQPMVSWRPTRNTSRPRAVGATVQETGGYAAHGQGRRDGDRAGDFHVSTTGDNLAQRERDPEKYGSKSFLFTDSQRTLRRARGWAAPKNSRRRPEEIALCKKVRRGVAAMMTALHEVIGHARASSIHGCRRARNHLKEYCSTLEEARADLVALMEAFDSKLRNLGLVTSSDVGKAMYYDAVRGSLTQLMRIPKGDTIEEDHQRTGS